MLAVYLYQLEVIEKNIISISMKLQWYSLTVQYISFYPVTPYICTVLQFERWCHFGKNNFTAKNMHVYCWLSVQ